MGDLRAHLQAAIAGEQRPKRGNAIAPADLEASAPFALACYLLIANSVNSTGERLAAPPESVPPLP